MKLSPLRKLLKDNLELNPFNDKFQKESYYKFILEKLSYEQLQNDELNEVLKVLPFLNDNFKEFYEYIKQNILNSNLHFNQLIDLLFSSFNRNFLILYKQIEQEAKNNKDINQKRFYSYKVHTQDKSVGKIEAAAALESDIDALIYVINYLRYFSDKTIQIDNRKNNVHPVEISIRIAFSSNYYNVLKSIYDDSIWNMGIWKLHYDGLKPKLQVIYKDTELLILNKVGLLRLQRNISSNVFFAINEIHKNSNYGRLIAKAIEQKYRQKRIKSVSIKDGFIHYQLAKGFGKNELYTELKNSTAYFTYYIFLKNIQFESFHELALSDLMKLFSLLQDLIEEVAKIDFDDSVYSINDNKKFPIKIAHNVLVNYLLERSTYSKPQITVFIELISFKFGERINLWDRPFVRYNGSYYINYLPTLAPIILNLIDYWIEKGGYDLDIRGKFLEKYLQNELDRILSEKGYFNNVIKRSKLINKQKKFEELDLVIILKSVVIVAEVKCIKYPFDERDQHNSLKRLSKGVQQIKRKKEFIEKYKDEIPELADAVNDKELIPLVITNLPVFSGYSIEDVPIADFYLFESYFSTGKMTNGKIYRGGQDEIINEVFYYKNENEMNKNIKTFFKNPYPIKELKGLYQIVEQKISFETFAYDLYVTSAQIPDDFNPDL